MKNNFVERITPNEDQSEALKVMKKFLSSKTEKEFCLSGPGGTGKTTIVKELFLKPSKNDKDKFYVKNSVAGVCVSHKAKLVLQNHIPNSMTYAASVNLMIAFDEWGEMIFIPKTKEYRQAKLASYNTIIFDEASMISDEMRTILHQSCKPNAKFIYMGDHCQLPPIKPGNNRSYNPNADSSVFSIPNRYALTQKVRQTDGDPIAILCDECRTHIDGDHSLEWMKGIKSQYVKEENKGIQWTKEDGVLKSFISNFNDGKDVRILAYRNNRVNDLNDKVRRLLFPMIHDQRFVPGDLLVGNNQYAPMDMDDPIFYNGEDMVVEGVETMEVVNVECHKLWIKGKKLPIYVPTEEGIKDYNEQVAYLKKKAMQSKYWFDYMDYVKRFADVSYGYAVTLYKIQGSTLYGVYVDVHDIYGVKPLTPRRKLQSLYTGFSRPMNFLALF